VFCLLFVLIYLKKCSVLFDLMSQLILMAVKRKVKGRKKKLKRLSQMKHIENEDATCPSPTV